jgi:hypothetical protein
MDPEILPEPVPSASTPITPQQLLSVQPPQSKSNIWVWIAAGAIILTIGIGVGLALARYSPKLISSYEECVKANGNQIQLIYPGICYTKDGRSFREVLTDEEKKNLQPPDQNPDYKRSCVERGGLWLTEYLECESMSSPNLNSEWCTNLEGIFSECQSPCRHDPKFQSGEVNCATVCVKVCQFN